MVYSSVMRDKQKGNKMSKNYDSNSAIDFADAISNLISNIKKDYANWTTWQEGIDRFNSSFDVKTGKKYTKIISNGSVWGFIAVTDGVLKGIPYKFGDVFKAAGWRAPAKHVRGSIYLDRTDWFHWTGPRYL